MVNRSVRRALVSTTDKTGLAPFARGLVELGFEIISTGGTRRALESAGVAVTDLASVTGFPEIMDGRVKTLHPKVHGGILGRPDVAGDAAALAEHGITPFELVVCNLYRFEDTIAGHALRGGEQGAAGPPAEAEIAEALEHIDVGGPSMIRAAAKNYNYVGVVTSPDQYDRVLAALRKGGLPPGLRRELAAAAFERTARYDRAIADFMAGFVAADVPSAEELPSAFSLHASRRQLLRYGENPHQRGAFYVETAPPAASLAACEQWHGKELSYNNLLDLDAALAIVREFAQPAAVVIKHNNPCGCAIAGSPADAAERAFAGDPVSAFGSIVGFNRVVDGPTAGRLCLPGRFVEAVLAPGFTDEARRTLTTRPTWKDSVRLMACGGLLEATPPGLDVRRVSGGLLVQDRDDRPDPHSEWTLATNQAPNAAQRADLEFAWKVSKHVKSNAIVFAAEGAVVGVGAGQMSRLDSVALAARKAGERSRGAVMASDAFFPFRDGIDAAASAGIAAIVQPGGSRRDDEVIAACNERGIAMLLTGRRHFRH